MSKIFAFNKRTVSAVICVSVDNSTDVCKSGRAEMTTDTKTMDVISNSLKKLYWTYKIQSTFQKLLDWTCNYLWCYSKCISSLSNTMYIRIRIYIYLLFTYKITHLILLALIRFVKNIKTWIRNMFQIIFFIQSF